MVQRWIVIDAIDEIAYTGQRSKAEKFLEFLLNKEPERQWELIPELVEFV